MTAILFPLFFSWNLFAQEPCTTQLRGVFDIGSGSTKLTLAKVKVCENQTSLEEILDDQSSSPVALEAAKDSQGRISTEAQNLAVNAILDLQKKAFILAREKAPGLGEMYFSAVATHAYRTAKNKNELSEKIRALGLPLLEVTHQNEGRIGYEGLKAKGQPTDCGDRSLAVWDIGGGSWEWTQKSKKQTEFRGQEIGAEAFKSEIIKSGKSKVSPPATCDIGQSSPNPIGSSQIPAAVTKAQSWAKKGLRGIKIDSKRVCVVGIGGVHVRAVEAQIQKFWPKILSCVCPKSQDCFHRDGVYTRPEVQCLALYLSEKSDCDSELKSNYSTTAVSNLLWVLGFMNHLKINEVVTANVNMGHYLVQSSGELEFKSFPIPKP